MSEIYIDDIDRIPGVELFTGDKLRVDIEYACTLLPRNCFAEVKDYLLNPTHKLHLITGLRRTGKTVLQKQAIGLLSQEEFDKAIRINISEETSIYFSEIINMCEWLYSKGFRYFFIDEATETIDFPSRVKDMADTIANYGCHVFVTGTNSLSMSFARNHLEGRFEEIKTTRIPFFEWSRLLNVNSDDSIFEYLKYGGILDSNGVPVDKALAAKRMHSFVDSESADHYIYLSIALNMQNSIAKYAEGGKFYALQGLYDSNLLTNAIMRFVKLQNYPIAINSINESFNFEEVSSVKGSLPQKYTDAKNIIVKNSKKIKQDIADRLCLDNNAPRITEQESKQLFEYLLKMDVFRLSDVYVMPNINPEDRANENAYEEKKHILQTQPGIRSSQIQATIDTIWSVLRVHKAEISYQEFNRIAGATARGRMLEDVVLSDISDLLPSNCKAVKLEWKNDEAEFDIAVIDERYSETRIALYEVKYAKEYDSRFTEHLRNERAIEQIEEAFYGKVVTRRLLYNGETVHKMIESVNISEFLNDIGENFEHIF